MAAQPPIQPALPPHSEERPARILVVDDEPVFSSQIKGYLQAAGYDVVIARNGRDAVTAVDKAEFDLMLLDIVMPMLNGSEVVKTIRSNPVTAALPIIVVSSMTEYKERVEFFRIGASDYMPKPIEKGELLARVGMQLQMVKLRRQVEAANASLMQQNRMLEQYLSRLEHDLSVARSVQRALLPDTEMEGKGLSIHYRHLSSENLGSDYFDYILDSAGNTHIIIADVSGHGIASALLAAQLKVVFASLIPRKLPPKDFVAEVNKLSVQTLTKGYYFTAVYMVYQPGTQRLSVVNGGHTPVLYYSSADRSVKQVESDNSPLGFFENEEYEEFHFTTRPGDIALLFTDGISEHTNSMNEMFETSRVSAGLVAHAGLQESDLISALVKDARDFGSTPVFKDDLTLAVIKFK